LKLNYTENCQTQRFPHDDDDCPFIPFRRFAAHSYALEHLENPFTKPTSKSIVARWVLNALTRRSMRDKVRSVDCLLHVVCKKGSCLSLVLVLFPTHVVALPTLILLQHHASLEPATVSQPDALHDSYSTLFSQCCKCKP
jgi:hypothetical protein